MILHGIKARNFMSLRDSEISELDEHINFLVGPNGSGKTTIFRALKAMKDSFKLDKHIPFNQLCSRGANPQEIDLTIDVEFNTPWEQELITTFVCASLSRPNELPNVLSSKLPKPFVLLNTRGYATFSNWLLQTFSPEKLLFLFRGKIHLSYRSQNYENFLLYYTFEDQGSPITVTIRPSDGILMNGDAVENVLGGYSSINGLVDFFHERVSLQDIINLLNEQSLLAENVFDPVACLRYLVEKKVVLGIDYTNSQQAYLPAQRRFAELSGYLNTANSSNRNFGFGYVLQLILDHSFVFTNNLRVPISDISSYDWQNVIQSTIDLDDERQIPLLLYKLKNGTFTERRRFQRIQETFQALVGHDQSFDITASVSKEQQPELSIDIQITDSEGEIPLDYHGAGVWESLMLSTILDESEGRVVLLDEPAANLHPGWQQKLVSVFRTMPGQVLVVTHSASMLPKNADDFNKVLRMQKVSTGTFVYGISTTSWLRSNKIEKELNKSSDVAGLLFANGVILVEGETESALSEWFPKCTISQGKTLADMNLALFGVGGKTNFPFYMHFLSEFGIPWVIICDGDAVPLDKNKNLWTALKSLQLVKDAPTSTNTFEELKVIAERAGVYTANTSPTENFESIPDVAHYKKNKKVYGEGKVQQGHNIAQHISCPQEIEEILLSILHRFNLAPEREEK